LRTSNKNGLPVKITTCENDFKENRQVAESIKEKIANGVKEDDIAVLYRINKLSRNLEDQLNYHNVAYKMSGSLRFYDRAEVKDIIAYLKIIYNNHDDLAFTRVCNVPKRKLGSVTIKKMAETAKKEKTSLFEVAKEFGNPNLDLFVKAVLNNKVKIDKDVVKGIRALLAEIKYEKYLKDTYTNSEVVEKMENIDMLIETIRENGKKNKEFEMTNFLNDISLDSQETKAERGIHLMTIHAAKGLEFKYVYLIGVRDGVLPVENANIEEERRLMYVASTRAKKELNISYSLKSGYHTETISPFLTTIPDQFIDYYDVFGNKVANSTIKIDKKVVDVITPSSNFKKGQKISHKKFGKGLIRKVEKDGSVEIVFDEGTVKTIIPSSKILKKIK